MQPQKPKHKKRWMLLLAASAVVLSACAGLPTPPTGKMYLHFGESALCSDLESGQICQKLPISQTQKFIMFEPQTWANIQNYIDALIREITNQNSSPPFLASSNNSEILQGLYKIKAQMKQAERNWKRAKKS